MALTDETARNPARSKPPRSGLARSSLSVVAGVLLALILTEALLRFGLGLGNPILIQADSACAYILKPDQNVVRFFARTRTNHLGMRSDELLPQRRADTLRVMFVGDSVTYGSTQVNQADIFTEVLHRELPAIVHRPVEVLNASAGAWAPDNELSYIQSRGIFNADIVFLVLNDGDLAQPRSTIADVGDGLPVQRPATAIGELFTRYIRPRLAGLVAKPDAGDRAAQNAEEEIHANLGDLDQINRIVRSQGARLVVLYIPFRRDIPNESVQSAEILRKWTDANHLQMVDLTSAEAEYTSRQITIDNGIHLNAQGHRLVAKAVERSWPELFAGR